MRNTHSSSEDTHKDIRVRPQAGARCLDLEEETQDEAGCRHRGLPRNDWKCNVDKERSGVELNSLASERKAQDRVE